VDSIPFLEMTRDPPEQSRPNSVDRHALTFAANRGVGPMLFYGLVFLVVAIVAGVLGFGGVVGASAGIAQILFFLFLAILVISFIGSLMRRT
jgi:uncharacterized membrane protein YtjA (UPF0391 family)